MFFIALGWSIHKKAPYSVAVLMAFTAGSNSFELVIAVFSNSFFGISSLQAFTGVI